MDTIGDYAGSVASWNYVTLLSHLSLMIIMFYLMVLLLMDMVFAFDDIAIL